VIVRCPNERCQAELEYDDLGFDFAKPLSGAARKIFKCDVCKEVVAVVYASDYTACPQCGTSRAANPGLFNADQTLCLKCQTS
jgi:hypothetical protein